MERISALLSRTEPVKWLFYGDSITHGAVHTLGARDYTEHFSERLRTELGRRLDIVLKTAISGNTTRELLAEFDWRAGQFHPDAVFLMIGMNDCSTTREKPVTVEEFEANLHELVNRFEALNTVAVLQTTCPILPGTAPEREPCFPIFMDAIRRVAKERNCPLVDHTAYWLSKPGSVYQWMANAFHPNGMGHLVFAHYLHEQLGIHDPQTRVGRLFVD